MSNQMPEDERLRILDFWWMVELFSPQPIPEVSRKASGPADRQVVSWEKGDPLPWEVLPPPEGIYGSPREWRHTVYLGVYELKATYESLQRVFGEDKDAYDERPGGTSACAGVVVGNDGRLVAPSAVLSSALWAAARIHHPKTQGRAWMFGFEEAARRFLEVVDESEGQRRDVAARDAPPPYDEASLLSLRLMAQTNAGVDGFQDLATERVVIESVAVIAKREGDAVENDFLNSLYLDDLTHIRERISHRDVGAGLAAYLTGDSSLQTEDRIDVVLRPDVVDAGTAIERLPKGRWPAKPTHPLALSQQFAVNEALITLGPSAGLMGVNGPPGTGKTTMLRDILAANVVERARRLSVLEDAHDAFTNVTYRWKASDYPRSVPQLRPELTGFEMVVASANNAAVENVTDEIPAAKALDEYFSEQADYFGPLATEVLRKGAKQEEAAPSSPPAAWGLVAARLGNKRNRSTFHSAFWFDEKATGPKESDLPGVPRMQTLLKQWRDGEVPHKSWIQARRDFASAERRVDRLIGERRRAQERIQVSWQLQQHGRRLMDTIVASGQALQHTRDELVRHEPVEQRNQDALEQAVLAHERRLGMKPGLLETIFSAGGALHQWRRQLAPVSEVLRAAEEGNQHAADLGSRLRAVLNREQSHLAGAEQDLERIRQRQVELRDECSRDASRYGMGYPGEKWVGDAREKNAPWLDPELDVARSELFLAALELHKDFMAVTASDMLNGLRAACEVVAGKYPRDLESEKLRAAWQLFFLVVPMVSTTFASASRMFGNIGREAIGWLMIDEAGQASPQYAVGAIWRARRVVAVGDPMQLQPVVTIPPKVQSDIASGYAVSSTWIPPRASVQTLADRVTKFGTVLDQGEERIWVSAPLRVHRRCDEPMFGLCNDIAYNGIMVNGVHRDLNKPDEPDLFDREDPTDPIIARSHWVDEPARVAGTHLQLQQIKRVEGAIAYLKRHGITEAEIIVISPFREVADRLKIMAGAHPGLRAGTIHTAQGREAPVVILVLGGDPNKPGAKTWAASTPNLVNVAASRAQRRLYVVGDRGAWKSHPYFRELSALLG